MTSLVVVLDLALAALRGLAVVAAVVTAVLAVLSVAVRTRRLSPFGAAARLARGTADPLFAPMERRLVRAGGLPAHAPWWTLAAVVVGGLLVIALLEFVRGQLLFGLGAASAGPRGVLVLVVTWVFALLRAAVLVRVLSSWVQMGRYSKWTRWAYALTDWFMEPLARVIPTIGMFDITPLVAYFGLGLLQRLVLSAAV